jgi:toxin ParE1/3/4
MVEVNWTSQAINDIDNIATFIANDSPKYAVRELLLGNYRIIYRIVSDFRVDILTVYHSKRILDKELL